MTLVNIQSASPSSTAIVGVRGDEALLACGWERRCLVDEHRATELRDLYKEMGLEVHLQSPEESQFSDACQACASSCSTHVLVYTRKKER